MTEDNKQSEQVLIDNRKETQISMKVDDRIR